LETKAKEGKGGVVAEENSAEEGVGGVRGGMEGLLLHFAPVREEENGNRLGRAKRQRPFWKKKAKKAETAVEGSQSRQGRPGEGRESGRRRGGGKKGRHFPLNQTPRKTYLAFKCHPAISLRRAETEKRKRKEGRDRTEKASEGSRKRGRVLGEKTFLC